MEIQQRLAEFFRRLQAAPTTASADEALALVCRLIEEVEEELCPLPRQVSPPLHFTGRMYPPREDRIRRAPDGSLVANTLHHRVYCAANGSITITHMPTRRVEISKAGSET